MERPTYLSSRHSIAGPFRYLKVMGIFIESFKIHIELPPYKTVRKKNSAFTMKVNQEPDKWAKRANC